MIDFFRNFVENHPEFKCRKFELNEIFRQQEQLKIIAKKIIIDVIFHNLPVVKNMYTTTFDIAFPNIEAMQKHVLRRHDWFTETDEQRTDYHDVQGLA